MRDVVLLAQLALVRLDLPGERRAEVDLALLCGLELRPKILDLRADAVQLGRGRLLEVIARELGLGLELRLLRLRSHLCRQLFWVQPLAQLRTQAAAEAAFSRFGLGLLGVVVEVVVLTAGHLGFAPSRRSSGR